MYVLFKKYPNLRTIHCSHLYIIQSIFVPNLKATSVHTVYSCLVLHEFRPFPFGEATCSNNDVKPRHQVLEIRFHALFITSSVGSGALQSF